MDDTTDHETNPFGRVVGPWEQVIDDMHATAEGYREDGLTVIECHPGDVATLTGEPRTGAELAGQDDPDTPDRRLGLDVVVPGNEFDDARSALTGPDPTYVDVFQATGNGMVFLLFGLQWSDTVLLVPAYYDQSDEKALRDVTHESGLSVYVRPLADDERVVFTLDDPEPCFPE